MKRLTRHAATVASLQAAVNGDRFTTEEFRERIAAILRVPGQPPTFKNSAHPSLVRRPTDKGYNPPRRNAQ